MGCAMYRGVPFWGADPSRLRMRARPFGVFYRQDEGSGGGGGSGGGSGGSGDVEARLQQAMDRLLARKDGDTSAVIKMLLSENHDLRDTNRTLREKQVPEGGVILAQSDAALWEKYKALGSPDDLQTAKTERDASKGELKKRDREQHLRDVAEVAGYKAKPLQRLATKDSGDPLEFEIETVEGEGKRVIVIDGDKRTPISEYAEREWADWLPSLTTTGGAGAGNGQGGAQYGGYPFPGQQGAAGGATGQRQGGDAADTYLTAAYSRKKRS